MLLAASSSCFGIFRFESTKAELIKSTLLPASIEEETA
jgi:hypothetical protein